MKMAPEIFFKNISKKYPSGTEALKGVNLEVNKGELFSLLGPNGAGKSTLVKIATTLIKKDSGEFLIGERNPDHDPKSIRQYIGVALQDNELDPSENAESLLRFQGRLFGLSKAQAMQRADELIHTFEIDAERTKKSHTLSGGNKRRLHCALALVHKPRLLFLDEPTTGMDPEARDRFWQTISRLNKKEGVTVFLTTQYLEEADKHATQMAMIMEGAIRYVGSVKNFKQRVNAEKHGTLEESYLAYVKQTQEHEAMFV